MSKKHPIIAVTGSSGSGTSTVKDALEHIFRRVGARAATVEGDSFHRFERQQMKEALEKAKKEGCNLSHFGPEGNLFDDQSLVLIHFLKPKPSIEYKLNLKGLIDGTMITGFNTLVIPGGKMTYAMELILTQRVIDLLKQRADVSTHHL